MRTTPRNIDWEYLWLSLLLWGGGACWLYVLFRFCFG